MQVSLSLQYLTMEFMYRSSQVSLLSSNPIRRIKQESAADSGKEQPYYV